MPDRRVVFGRVVAGFGEVQLRPVDPEGDLDLGEGRRRRCSRRTSRTPIRSVRCTRSSPATMAYIF